MTDAQLAALLAGVAFYLLLLVEKRVTIASILLLGLAPITIGFGIVSDERGSTPGGIIILAAPLILTLGFIAGRGYGSGGVQRSEVYAARGLGAVSIILILLTVVHFALSGVPALSRDVEKTRFEVGSSGLFGLPSRSVLFGLPIMVLLVASQRERASRSVLIALIGTFVVSRMALGFKGGVYEVVIVLLSAALIRGRPLRARALVLLSVGVLAAFAYAMALGDRYATLAAEGGVGRDYFVDRLTTTAAEPAWYLQMYREEVLPGSSAMVHDARYFAAEYAGIGPGEDFAVDQMVSALVTGTPLDEQVFLVPVTLGGTAYLYGSGGPILAIGGLFLLGALYVRSAGRLSAATGFREALAAAAFLTGARIFILNGGGVYVLVNYVAVYLFLLVVYLVFSREPLFRPRRMRFKVAND